VGGRAVAQRDVDLALDRVRGRHRSPGMGVQVVQVGGVDAVVAVAHEYVATAGSAGVSDRRLLRLGLVVVPREWNALVSLLDEPLTVRAAAYVDHEKGTVFGGGSGRVVGHEATLRAPAGSVIRPDHAMQLR